MALNPIIKFTTLFGLLAVELAVSMKGEDYANTPLTLAMTVVLPAHLDVLRLPLLLRHADLQQGVSRRRAAGHRLPDTGLG